MADMELFNTVENIPGTKFADGNGDDGKHYWLAPWQDPMIAELKEKYGPFDFDPCPYPRPDDFDGLTCEWGMRNWVNPPFGSIMHNGKKKGPTAWMRKAIEEQKKGKFSLVVYPVDKWILMMLAACGCSENVINLGDVKWLAIEDGSQGKGTGRHIACFILEPKKPISPHPIVTKPETNLPISGLGGYDQVLRDEFEDGKK
jgi:hypothetical protein